MIKLSDILIEQVNNPFTVVPSHKQKNNKKDKKPRKKKRWSKKNQTKAYLSQIENHLEPDQFERFMQVYDLAGKPNLIDPNHASGLINKKIQKNINKGMAGAAYNAFQDDILGLPPIGDNNIDQTLFATLAEIPHALQFKKHDGWLRNLPHAISSLGRYARTDLIKSKLKKDDPYKTKDKNYSEYHAHEEMEKVLRDYVMHGDPSGKMPKRVTDLKGQKPKDFEWDKERFHVNHAHESIIKLKDILMESISKKEIMDIVNKVYPHIVKDLGGKKLPVVVHNNIYRRLKAVGEEELMKQNNPFAQYDWDTKKIYLYSSAMKNVEEIIRSLLHEHTHSLQNKKKFDDGYDSGKYNYKTHPYEIAANKAEKKWKNYLKYIK